jgi:hypothetical protein
MFPPSALPDRTQELVDLTRQLAGELQARGGQLRQFGYARASASALVRAPDGTDLVLTLKVVPL